MTTASKGSIGFSGTWEFLIAPDGDLYRAPKYLPIDMQGYRQGSRFEATAIHNKKDRFAGYLALCGFDPLTIEP